MRQVYADTAATTRPAPEVVAAMLPYLGDAFGNASSVHRRGEAAREAVELARVDVARLVGRERSVGGVGLLDRLEQPHHRSAHPRGISRGFVELLGRRSVRGAG